MKTLNTSSNQISQIELAKLNSKAVKNSALSKTGKKAIKVRNFGWLVAGMVEACHQISVNDLAKVD